MCQPRHLQTIDIYFVNYNVKDPIRNISNIKINGLIILTQVRIERYKSPKGVCRRNLYMVLKFKLIQRCQVARKHE